MEPSVARRTSAAALMAVVLLGSRALAHASAADDAESPATWAEIARPTALTPDEEASPACETLARRFNPAMAFMSRDIWPVEVRYAWHDGADLVARVIGANGQTEREYVAVDHARLLANDWGDLADRDEHGNRIEYHVDAPGDDRVEHGASGWVRRWRAIMSGSDGTAHAQTPANPSAAAYTPTQYAHLFWLDREKGLLAIQYWFYYPYNEWINHHEGDWEHVNVVLRGPSRLRGDAGYRVVGHQFFFHTYFQEPAQTVRVAGRDAREDHVVVYTGGTSRFLMWSGNQSGGSYPLPAVYPGAGGGLAGMKPSDDTTHPQRFIRADEFRVVVLPEPDRIDVGQRPELSWLRLSFFAGQSRVYRNPLSLNGLSFGTAPRQPARQESWNAEAYPAQWPETPRFDAAMLVLPHEWMAIVDRGAAADNVAARRSPGAHGARPHGAQRGRVARPAP